MEQIVSAISSNFDFAYMLSINVLTYILIKAHDILNGLNPIKTWTKRLYLLISIIIVTVLYIIFTEIQNNILINSIIAAPVFWSWVLKPICIKFNIDYKKIDNTLN